MTTRTMMLPVPAARAVITLTLAAALLAAGPMARHAAAQSGGGGETSETALRSTLELAKLPRAAASRAGRATGPLNSSMVTPNDSFVVVSHGFDDPSGACLPRGWTGQDLTSRVFAHVSGRFTVNDGFVNMGTRALWFGADSSSALDEISTWVRPYGYGNGWNQRLTSPAFSVSANPGAVLSFDVSMELRRPDGGPTNAFTPYGLASGKVAHDALSVEVKRADGSWTPLHGRFALNGGPAWNNTAPLYGGRYNPIASFSVPNGIAVDDSGNVYVADRGNNRIVKTNSTGLLLTTWGTLGGGAGQFNSPFDVAVDHEFKVYVVDAGMRVQKFDHAGNFILQWGTPGTGIGQFDFPVGIDVDHLNNVYVVDQGNHRIQKFSSTGSPILQFGSQGTSFLQFQSPTGIAIDPNPATFRLFVSDTGNNRIQSFTLNGAFNWMWGATGTADSLFSFPSGLDVDAFGHVWVADRGNNRIQRFRTTGQHLLTTGTLGAGGGHFFSVPRDIAISPDNDVYVVESGNNRFQTFSIGGPIAGEGTFQYEVRFAEDGNASIPLAEPTQVRIVMQSNTFGSSQDGNLFPGQQGVILVDNITLEGTGGDILAPVDFEDGTTGDWALGAFNQGSSISFNFRTASRDFEPPATAIALRSGFDSYDPTCVWTFLSPGDTLRNGVYARLQSPWIGLVPGDTSYAVSGTSRLNTLIQSRFAQVYTRVKRAGDSVPREYHAPNFILFGTTLGFEGASPLTHDLLLQFPEQFLDRQAADSVQIVIDIMDQPERLMGILPQQRPTARLPILDDIAVVQRFVDSDYDGVADAHDACPNDCAAGQDADGDGCVDATATLHHVESWAPGPIRYRINAAEPAPAGAAAARNPQPLLTFSPAHVAAIRAGFEAWMGVDGAEVPLLEEPLSGQTNAAALDGINLVTGSDSDLQFPPGVLAVTPTTSFTRRAPFFDRMALPGEIVDSDMILNPNAAFTTTGEPSKHDLQSVVTHEAGHMLGLSHTGVLDATMFFVIQPSEDARSLTNDDQAAVAAAYPAANFATDFGTITGTVLRGQSGDPLPGALVSAVRLNSEGAIIDTTASDYTREDGGYALRRLPAGSYAVRVTPLDGNVGGFPLTAAYISHRLAAITVHNTFVPEWWTEVETDRDDPTLFDPVAVLAAQTVAGINVTTTVDTIPPAVTSVLPADQATNVGIDTPILVNFSEPIAVATLEAAFRVRKDGQPPALAGSGQLLNGTSFVFTPSAALEFASSYQIEINTALTDLEGVPLAAAFTATFATQQQPPLSIADIQPRSAPVGALVTITGAGFDSNVGVAFSFPPQAAAIVVPGSQITPTSLVVRVPQGAMTGDVQLVRNLEVSNGFAFTVLPPRPQVAPVQSGGPVSLGALAPRDVAVSPDGATVYVVGDGGLASVDLTQPGRPVTLHASGPFQALALTPDGTRAVFGERIFRLVHVYGAVPGGNLGIPLASIQIDNDPGGIAISPDGKRAYATDQFETVYEIDIDPQSPTAYSVRRHIFIPGVAMTSGIAVSLDGTKLYLTTSNHGLIQAEIPTGVFTVLNPSPNNGGIGVTPSGGEVLAPGAYFSGSLVLATLPLSGPAVPGTLAIGGAPRDIGITPEGQSALVVNSATNEMHVLDVAPGSGSYHNVVSTVGTGPSPLAVGVSPLSQVVAVANYGDNSLTIYTTANADNGLQRVSPDVALVGDQVAVHSSNDLYNVGTTVDLAAGAFPSDLAIGTAVTFTVPPLPSHQRTTTLTLETPDGTRSLVLPFKVVDPITAFTPRLTTQIGSIPLINCFNPEPEQGRVYRMRISPDGRIMAMVRSLNDGECHLVDFVRVSADAPQPPGTLLTSASLAHISITDITFSPDGRRLWVVRAGDGGVVLDSDPASVTFGQSVGSFVQGVFGHFPFGAAADPLNRYMVVSNSDPTPGNTITLYNVDGTIADTTATPQLFTSIVVSRNGRFAVMGGLTGVAFYSLESRDFLPTPPQDPGVTDVQELVVTSDGRRAVGRMAGGSIAVWNLDPAAGAIGASLYFGQPVAASIHQMVEGSDGHSVLLACSNCNDLYKLDVSTAPPTVTSADAGQPFTALARTPDGRRLWGIHSQAVNALQHTGDLRMFTLADAQHLTLVAGGGQSGFANATLPVPIRVRVTGAGGSPQAGVMVRFTAPGLIDGITGWPSFERLTDTNGEAQVTWTLPDATPGTQSVTVEALGGPAAPLTVDAALVATDADIVPAVIQFGPADGATNIAAGSPVSARFNQRMDLLTLPGFVQLAVNGGPPLAGTFSFQEEGRVAVFKPAVNLPFGASCTFTVNAGATDLDGQVTAAAQSASFTVQPPPSLTVTALSPIAAHSGATVVIGGDGFSPTPSSNVVTFNGVLAPVQLASLTSLTTAVPVNATSGPVRVLVGNVQSTPLEFTVLTPDPTPGQLVGETPAAPGVSRIAFSRDGTRAYVTNPPQNSVTVLDVIAAEVITSITVGLEPGGIAILPDGSRAYVANKGSDNLSVIDIDPNSPTYHTVVNTIGVGDEPVDVAVSGVGPRVFVANAKSGTVSIIDANPQNGTFDQVVTTINTGSGSASVEISPDGGRIYVGTATAVVMVDLGSLVVTTINTGSGSASVEISPDGTLVLALLFNGQLVVIDALPGSPTFNQVVTTINAGSGAGQVEISPDGTLAYVTSADGNTVLVFQIVTSDAPGQSSSLPGPPVALVLLTSIPVGETPMDIAFSPTGNGLGLVPNAGSGTISFIGLPTSLPPIEVAFEFNPNALNLKSMGRWVKGTITPPEPFTPGEIVIASIRLNGVVAVDPAAPVTFRTDPPALEVRFLRASVQLVLAAGEEVPVTVTGTIGARTFTGTDHIRVIQGQVHAPHAAQVVNPLAPFTVRWATQGTGSAQWVALLHSVDHGVTWSLDATHLPNTGEASWQPPVVVSDSVRLAVVAVESAAPGDTMVVGVLGVSDYFRLATPTAVEPLPLRLEFSPVTPSPSVGAARLRYGLPRATRVELEIFDLMGRRLTTLVSGEQGAGWYALTWDGRTDAGGRAGSGLYFARMRAEGQVLRQRVVWIR